MGTTKKSKGAEGTKSTDSGSDDAVNCSTHDDCNDLYPDQLDDNWLAVTDDKKKKSSGSGSGSKKVAKATKALDAANNNPYTADDTWNCEGAGGRCTEESSSDSSSTTKKSKGAEGTKSTDSGSDDAVNCSTHDDCNDLYPDQLDDNWLAV